MSHEVRGFNVRMVDSGNSLPWRHSPRRGEPRRGQKRLKQDPRMPTQVHNDPGAVLSMLKMNSHESIGLVDAPWLQLSRRSLGLESLNFKRRLKCIISCIEHLAFKNCDSLMKNTLRMTPDELSDRLWSFAARIGKVVEALPDTRLGRHCGFAASPH